MNKQEIFNRIAVHLLSQKDRSVDDSVDDYQCVYRGPGGIKCAIGCLITDDAYTDKLENNNIYDYKVQSALIKSGVIDRADASVIDFLARMQEIHDDTDVVDWKRALIALAKKFKLDFSCCNDFSSGYKP